ncbi:MAG: hypothetical protein ABI772_06465 [Bacteroidota bacterium]
MKCHRIYIAVLLLLTCTYSCKKEEGKGGNSSIIGNVIVKEFSDANFLDVYNEHNGFDEKVYIIYGGETGVGDNVTTSIDGSFEFKYLRKGDYKVYVVSKDSAHATPFYVPDTIFVKEVEIKEKKETVNAGTFYINKVLN